MAAEAVIAFAEPHRLRAANTKTEPITPGAGPFEGTRPARSPLGCQASTSRQHEIPSGKAMSPIVPIAQTRAISTMMCRRLAYLVMYVLGSRGICYPVPDRVTSQPPLYQWRWCGGRGYVLRPLFHSQRQTVSGLNRAGLSPPANKSREESLFPPHLLVFLCSLPSERWIRSASHIPMCKTRVLWELTERLEYNKQ
ncbi:unnamed protein product [Leptosia nina]|uniref:Uncharacterized protein n=1 Tax=Leptosia nina TaxID=320188 RepID=A0AAV1JU31_9NEOP